MNTAIFSETDQLRQENKFLQFKIEELVESNRLLMENCTLLKEQLEWFKRQLFGQKSERFISGGSEESYLPGLEPTEEEKAKEETILVPAHEKRKAKSTLINTISFPDDLPKETKILDLTAEEKIDSKTGKTLVCIGEEVSRKLAMKANVYFIKEIIRKKYAVPGDADQGIKIANLPDSIIPRCAVDESFLADVVTKKFCDHLPLYRQAEIRTRDNVYVSKQTLSSYVIRVGDVLKPLYDLLEETIKTSGNVFTDETPVDVLAPGTGKTRQGYMTVMVGGASLNPALRVYRFLSSRKHDDVMDWFTDYKGVFHSDKYQAYEKLAKEKDKTWCPCWSHVRRKFEEAESGDPKFRKSVLLDIQQIFAIEEKTASLPPEERVRIRKEEATPIIDSLITKNIEISSKHLLPKSKLKNAINYLLGLSPYLKNYIENPYARPDNNVAERALKLVVIGRKNWLFIGSEGGGNAAAVLYSLAQTCRALKINPFSYFEDVLRRIQGHTFNKLHELLPQNWEQQP